MMHGQPNAKYTILLMFSLHFLNFASLFPLKLYPSGRDGVALCSQPPYNRASTVIIRIKSIIQT